MCRVADQPEEQAHSSPTGSSVGSARSHVLPVQLAEAAGALRAQHGPTNQAQGRMLSLIIGGFWTPEDGRDGKVEHLQPTETQQIKKRLLLLTENGWLYWAERCNPQEDQSNDSFSLDIYRKNSINKRLLVEAYYKPKLEQKKLHEWCSNLTIWALPFRILVIDGLPHHLDKTKPYSYKTEHFYSCMNILIYLWSRGETVSL